MKVGLAEDEHGVRVALSSKTGYIVRRDECPSVVSGCQPYDVYQELCD